MCADVAVRRGTKHGKALSAIMGPIAVINRCPPSACAHGATSGISAGRTRLRRRSPKALIAVVKIVKALIPAVLLVKAPMTAVVIVFVIFIILFAAVADSRRKARPI